MPEAISLKQIEKKAFTAAYGDGLWDILLGCFVLIFAIAPLLSVSLGDLWSSAVFLPFWALAYLAIRLVRRHVIAPRAGTAKFGRARKAKLRKLTVVMVAINLAALALGLVAASNLGRVSGHAFAPFLGLIILAGFSVAAHLLGFARLYLYGLLIGLSPLVGEWLYIYKRAAHHGFPLTFSITAAVMIVTGLVLFVRMMREAPLPVEAVEGRSPEGA